MKPTASGFSGGSGAIIAKTSLLSRAGTKVVNWQSRNAWNLAGLSFVSKK